MATETSSQMHRGVFTWPPANAFKTDSIVTPGDIGIDLIENDFKTELINMIQEAKEFGRDEPFCIFDMDLVLRRFQSWKNAFPSIRPFFAVKAHDDPVVIKLLAQLGAGFDCASKYEIELVQKLGAEADDIVFANPIRIPSHLAYAAEKGVSLLTFDTIDELHKIKSLYPRARLLLRVCPVQDENVGDIAVPFSRSFGVSLKDVPDILIAAKELDLSIVGVAFFAGSDFQNVEYLLKQIPHCRKVFDMAEEHGFQMSILDIGGGFPGAKGAEEHLFKLRGPLNKYIVEMFPDVTVISEPGRFFVESSMTLATSVIGKRNYGDGDPADDEFVISTSSTAILNRGLARHFLQRYRYTPILALRNPLTQDRRSCVLRGPTCLPPDIIRCSDVPDLEIGDWLIFEEVGAYTVTFAVAFNGFPIPPIRRVMTKNIWESGFVKSFF